MVSCTPTRHATGPRTEAGKRRSRYNAVTHAIFAVGINSERESLADYHALVDQLVRSRQPVGRLEEIVVEKLAMLFWRYRRLLQAEATALARSAGPPQKKELENGEEKDIPFRKERGLIGISLLGGDTKELLKALERMVELREKVKSEGPNWERDRETMELLLGTRRDCEPPPNPWTPPRNANQDMEAENSARASMDLLKKYGVSAPFERGPMRLEFEKEPMALTGNGTVDLAMALTHLVEFLQSILAGRVLGGIHSRCGQPREAGGMLLRPEIGDQLLRYEATLERAIDRTIAQLERLQRMRLGQPVPPSIDVNVR